MLWIEAIGRNLRLQSRRVGEGEGLEGGRTREL